MLEEGEIQTLIELGLSNRQTRVFLNLLKYESSTARVLSIASNLARPDIYTVLEELQELGIIEKQIDTPAKFIAIPLQDALSILLDRKAKQATDLEKKTRILISSLEKQGSRTTKDEEPKLSLIPEGETLHKVRSAIVKSQKSIDIVSSSKNLPQGIFSIGEDLERATSRGVKIRCLTDTLAKIDSQEAFRGLMKNSSFEIRTMPNHSWARFCIYDKEELSVVLSQTKDFCKSSLIWANCTNIVEAYVDHFEMMWLNANSAVLRKDETTRLPKAINRGNIRRPIQSLAG